MNYDEFKKQIVEEIKDYLPEKYQEADVRIQQVTKNNDKELDGLVVMLPDSNVSPNIYLNSFYEDYKNGKSLEDILDTVAGMRTEHEIDHVDVESLTDWENVKDKITARVCCVDENQQRLSNMPHMMVEDLAATFHIDIGSNEFGTASIPVSNQLMEKFGVDADELFRAAMGNIGKEDNVRFAPMSDTIKEMLMSDMPPGMDEEVAKAMVEAMMPEQDEMLYVLTNESKVNGAALILNDDVRQTVAEQLGGDYFVLPSSIHECLIVPKDAEMDFRELQNMVQEVNDVGVSPEEKLSDYVYEYDAQTHELMRCDHAQERKLDKEASAGRVEKTSEQESKSDRPSLKGKLDIKKQEAAGLSKEAAPKKEHKKEASIA